MMGTLFTVGVVIIAACGVVGLLGYFTHRSICLLQTEVERMEAVATRQKEKAESINREIRTEE